MLAEAKRVGETATRPAHGGSASANRPCASASARGCASVSAIIRRPLHHPRARRKRGRPRHALVACCRRLPVSVSQRRAGRRRRRLRSQLLRRPDSSQRRPRQPTRAPSPRLRTDSAQEASSPVVLANGGRPGPVRRAEDCGGAGARRPQSSARRGKFLAAKLNSRRRSMCRIKLGIRDARSWRRRRPAHAAARAERLLMSPPRSVPTPLVVDVDAARRHEQWPPQAERAPPRRGRRRRRSRPTTTTTTMTTRRRRGGGGAARRRATPHSRRT